MSGIETKLTNIKIESADGTLTDLTPFITSVEFKPYKPSIWKRLYIWLYGQWFTFKVNRAWRKLSRRGVTLDITFERRVREPWRWN